MGNFDTLFACKNKLRCECFVTIPMFLMEVKVQSDQGLHCLLDALRGRRHDTRAVG